jgi:hypothetical protein
MDRRRQEITIPAQAENSDRIDIFVPSRRREVRLNRFMRRQEYKARSFQPEILEIFSISCLGLFYSPPLTVQQQKSDNF